MALPSPPSRGVSSIDVAATEASTSLATWTNQWVLLAKARVQWWICRKPKLKTGKKIRYGHSINKYIYIYSLFFVMEMGKSSCLNSSISSAFLASRLAERSPIGISEYCSLYLKKSFTRFCVTSWSMPTTPMLFLTLETWGSEES